MPVKITLFVENVARGTALVEHAIADGAALGEFVEVEAPIKIKVPRVLKKVPNLKVVKLKVAPKEPAKAPRKRGRRVFHTSPHTPYAWNRVKNEARRESTRWYAHRYVNDHKKEFPKTRRETLDLLARADLTSSQCKTAFEHLVKIKVLTL
jgi:hypothetical protein